MVQANMDLYYFGTKFFLKVVFGSLVGVSRLSQFGDHSVTKLQKKMGSYGERNRAKETAVKTMKNI